MGRPGCLVFRDDISRGAGQGRAAHRAGVVLGRGVDGIRGKKGWGTQRLRGQRLRELLGRLTQSDFLLCWEQSLGQRGTPDKGESLKVGQQTTRGYRITWISKDSGRLTARTTGRTRLPPAETGKAVGNQKQKHRGSAYTPRSGAPTPPAWL